MPLSIIVVIVLRLFSLSWLVQGITLLAATVAALELYHASPSNIWSYTGSIFFGVAAVLTWVLAPAVARVVTPRPEAAIQVGGLTRYDLYCFAFVFLGLYFVLSSAGSMISQLHFYLVQASMPPPDSQRQSALYQLAPLLLTCLAGGLCIGLASPFARRLTDAQRRQEAV